MVCKNCGSATPDGYESVLTKGNKLEPEITSFRIEEKHQKKGINVKTRKKISISMLLAICILVALLLTGCKSTDLTEDSIVGIWKCDLQGAEDFNMVFAKSNRGYTFRDFVGPTEDFYFLDGGTYTTSGNEITVYSDNTEETYTYNFDAKNNCISTPEYKYYKIENSESTAESVNEKVSRFEYSGLWYCYSPSIPSTPHHYLYVDGSGVIYCSFNSSESPSNFSGFNKKYKLTYPDNYSVEPYEFSTDKIVMHATQNGLGVNNWTLIFNRSSNNEIEMKLNCDRMKEWPATGDSEIWNKIGN